MVSVVCWYNAVNSHHFNFSTCEFMNTSADSCVAVTVVFACLVVRVHLLFFRSCPAFMFSEALHNQSRPVLLCYFIYVFIYTFDERWHIIQSSSVPSWLTLAAGCQNVGIIQTEVTFALHAVCRVLQRTSWKALKHNQINSEVFCVLMYMLWHTFIFKVNGETGFDTTSFMSPDVCFSTQGVDCAS